MIDYPLLHKTLNKYIRLSVFQDQKFINLAKFEWQGSFSSIVVGGNTYTKREDVLRDGMGINFGYNFSLNPWPSREGYLNIINGLSGQAREDRISSRLIIRQIFLQNDNIKITDALLDLFSNNYILARPTLEWVLLTSNDHLLPSRIIHFPFLPDEIPEGFSISKMGPYKEITRDHLIESGLAVGDIFQLWLYSGSVHYDHDKDFLINILKNRLGEFIDSVIDMYTVILAHLSKHVIIPMIEGSMKSKSIKGFI